MASESTHKALQDVVRTQLFFAGWKDNDVLVQPLVRTERGVARPAFIAMVEGYPLASFDIAGSAATSGDLDLTLPIALESDGVVTRPCVPDPASSRARVATPIDEHRRWEPVPTPQELWDALGRNWTSTDARLAPLLAGQQSLHFAQAQTLAELLDAIMSGKSRALVRMGIGTGRFLVSIQFAHKMWASGRARRILIVEELEPLARQTRQRLVRDVERGSPSSRAFFECVDVELRSALSGNSPPQGTSSNHDLIIVSDMQANDTLADSYPNATFVGFVASPLAVGIEGLGLPVAELSVEDLVVAEEPAVPEGYRAVRLGDVAEIRSGLPRLRTVPDNAPTRTIVLLTGRSLETDGSWDPRRAERGVSVVGDEKDRARVRPGDLLVSAVASATKLRWTIVPTTSTDDIRIATSVLRIRIIDPSVRPQEVAAFIRSDAGYAALARLTTTAAGYLRFTASSLAQTLIHVPIHAPVASAAATPPPTPTAFALSQLRETIFPELIAAEENPSPDEVAAVAARTATRLRALATTLSPPSLLDRVVETYPFPIARAYRQLHDARFNAYEHVLRLRDVFEATAFFVYNVVLADAVRRLPRRYYTQDKGARRAFNGYSMAARISFVEHILAVGASASDDLFLPELTGTNFVPHARQLQRDFRNHISHTATATESQQRALFGQFAPTVDAMLTELGFLSEYRLVRIASYFVRNGQFVRRMEVYRGVAAQIEESDLAEGEPPTRAEHDHLVLLDAENEFLDLFPMYQLLASSETRNETHMCYLKMRNGQYLEGESAHTSIPVTISGYEQFVQLVSALDSSD